MATISLCMIVKNEEEVLDRCLKSAEKLADEIIIVDTGSDDGTKSIAKQYTDNIYEIPWKDDFAWTRNFSFSKASMDFCMWLDADDVIDDENRDKILKLKDKLNKDVDVVMMKYASAFDENGKSTFSYYRERLLKNDGSFRWEGRVHEAIAPHGKIVYTDAEIFHKKEKPGDSGRNLRIYEKIIAEGESLDPRSLFYYGRELCYHGETKKAEEVLGQFVKDKKGWLENKIEACLNLSECYEKEGKKEKALEVLFQSFTMDLPRAEICCRIGGLFQEEKRWSEAAFWYQTALNAEKKPERGGFIREDCYDYIPAVNLCRCYDRMGDHSKAYEYHRMAAEMKPGAKEVEWNEAYFQRLKKEEKAAVFDGKSGL